jgi:hypothetical protein
MLKKLVEVVDPNIEVQTQLLGVAVTVGRELESLDSRLKTQEIKKLLHGKDGMRGKKGEDGKDGKDGKDGLSIAGKDGKDGKNGQDGKDGISVSDASVAADGHLVFTLSNGNEIDAGELPEVGKLSQVLSRQLANPQIFVGTVAPASPNVGDLWYDIT